MQITSLTPEFGSTISGLDLSKNFNESEFAELHQIFIDRKFLVFKNQNLSPESQINFSKRFGPLLVHVLEQYNHPAYPEIFRLSNKVVDGVPMGITDGGSYWHSDFAFHQKPAKTTILYALEIPKEGGNTLFANMEAAYEALSDDWKKKLAGLKAIHRYRKRNTNNTQTTQVDLSEEQKKKTPDMIHPLIRTNPDSGKKAIFAHPGMTAEIVDLSPKESQEILDFLFSHTIKSEFRFEFNWSVGDVVMWDNRVTMHSATTRNLPPDQYRTIYRTTVQGERPI